MKEMLSTKDVMFISTFTDMQKDAATINRQSAFVVQEALIDDLERFLFTQTSSTIYDRFHPLIDMFKSARVGLKLMLAAGELNEALEAVRRNKFADDHIPEFLAEEAEIADAVIRLMNYATDRKLRLASAIVAKNEYNRTRHDHTAAGRAELGGKKF